MTIFDSPAQAPSRLAALYDSATDLELVLESVARTPGTALTAGQIGAFNQILADARELVPNSVALREDAETVDADTRPTVAYRVLRTTIVPTLHNALPTEEYERRI